MIARRSGTAMPAVRARTHVTRGSVESSPDVEVGPFFTYELEEPLLELIKRLRAPRGVPWCQEEMVIECAASCEGSAPDLELDPPVVAELADLGASLSLSLDYHPAHPPTAASSEKLAIRPQVYLRLIGTTLDPSEVTAATGATPTRTWRAGDPIGTGSARARQGNWEIEGDPEEDFPTQIARLRGAIGDPTLVRATAERLGAHVRLEVTWHFTPGTTRIVIDSDGLRLAALLGALLEFDPVVG